MDGVSRGQEDPRNVNISDVVDELRRRDRVPNDVSAMIEVVGEDIQRLSHRLRSLAAMQASSSLATLSRSFVGGIIARIPVELAIGPARH